MEKLNLNKMYNNAKLRKLNYRVYLKTMLHDIEDGIEPDILLDYYKEQLEKIEAKILPPIFNGKVTRN